MGRINLSAVRVRQRALANAKASRTDVLPIWADVVHDIPPAQIMTRQQPIIHQLTHTRTETQSDGRTVKATRTVLSASQRSSNKSKRPSRMYSPTQLQYEEDRLRQRFFADHPWELARPRVVLETTGNQHAGTDWSKGLEQPTMPLSGESVVQRQLYLLENTPDISVDEAYDIARKEFYTLRRRQATNIRIATEEAEVLGARFGPSSMSKALGIEDAAYNEWQKWAEQQNIEVAARNAAFAGHQQQQQRQTTSPSTPSEALPSSSSGAGAGAGDSAATQSPHSSQSQPQNSRIRQPASRLTQHVFSAAARQRARPVSDLS